MRVSWNWLFSGISSSKDRLQWSIVTRWGHQPHLKHAITSKLVTAFFVQVQLLLALKRVNQVGSAISLG